MNLKQNYELLKNRDIINILNGDTKIEEYNGVEIRMPYMSGPDLCKLSQKFGCFQEYKWGADSKLNLSRWKYMDNILDYVIKNGKINQFLSYIMNKERFSYLQNNFNNADDINNTYNYAIRKIIEKINSILFFGGHELAIVGDQYFVKKINEEIKIDVPNVNIIDRDYIKKLAERAIEDIQNNNFDSAITKSRTILEETFCYVIEIKGETPDDSGEISKLYKQVKDLYNMHTNSKMDVRINKLLSGLEKIVSGLAEMRNNGSDSHGLGNKRINLLSYHARLAVNSAVTMAEFILAVSQNNKN